MTTLAHPTTDGYGRPRDARALLERAIADAPSHVPAPAGWLRRLFARDRSAAALVRRYRLQPAIEHAYERVTREMGPVRVEISAEDSFGSEFVMVVFLCDSLDFDRMIELEEQVSDDCRSRIADRDWHRLLITLDPDNITYEANELVRS
ncbi:MAG: hypothetical protein ACJ8GN_08505 [Longimicrobiaceae bacterium]